MSDNDFQELEKLAKCWIGYDSCYPSPESIAANHAINDCGSDLLELLITLKERRAKRLNEIAKVAFATELGRILG